MVKRQETVPPPPYNAGRLSPEIQYGQPRYSGLVVGVLA